MKISRYVTVSCLTAVMLASAACGSDSDAGSASGNARDVKWTVVTNGAAAATAEVSTSTTVASETTTSTSTAPATSIEPVQTLAVFGNAQSAACVANRSIIDTALMTFVSATGSANATEAEMVGYGLIVGDVPGWQIGPGNVIIATPGGECAG